MEKGLRVMLTEPETIFGLWSGGSEKDIGQSDDI